MLRFKLWLPLLPIFLLTAVLVLSAPAHARGTKAYPENTYVLQVNGLACPYCAYGLEKQFAHQRGVTKTDINIVKGVAIVHVRPETRFSDTQLKQFVYDAGFALRRIVQRPSEERP